MRLHEWRNPSCLSPPARRLGGELCASVQRWEHACWVLREIKDGKEKLGCVLQVSDKR